MKEGVKEIGTFTLCIRRKGQWEVEKRDDRLIVYSRLHLLCWQEKSWPKATIFPLGLLTTFLHSLVSRISLFSLSSIVSSIQQHFSDLFSYKYNIYTFLEYII